MLLVCDNFSRVLETLLILEKLAEDNPDMQKLPIIYLDHMSKESIEIASSHLEWMNNRHESTFACIDTNLMNFKYIEKISSEDDLQKYQNPRIIVTTNSTFLLGHSRNLLPKVLKNKNSQLIFINKQLSHSLGPDLISGGMSVHKHEKITVKRVTKNVPLCKTEEFPEPKIQDDTEPPKQGLEDASLVKEEPKQDPIEESKEEIHIKKEFNEEEKVKDTEQGDLCKSENCDNFQYFSDQITYPMFSVGQQPNDKDYSKMDQYGIHNKDESRLIEVSPDIRLCK